MPHPLTVLVPCFNNQDIIARCLQSVSWADEIFVVDSGSTDQTREIAGKYTKRIEVHPYENSARQKNWAIPQAGNEWILVLDTDEQVTPELQQEIQKLLAGEPEYDGYYIYRNNHFFDIPIRHCGWENDDVLRLFRKSLSRYEDKHVHADVLVSSGRIGRLQGRLLHHTYHSFDQYLEKFGRYTTWGAKDLLKRGKRPGFCNLLLRPGWRFFRQYILRQGFRDGIPGLILCGLAAMSVFTKYARLWELRQAESGEEQ